MRRIIAYKEYFSDFIKKLSPKKTQKTPDSEIKKAIKLKEEYYDAKRNQ